MFAFQAIHYDILFYLQPLTELTDNKCKRCGLYEMDSIKSDDVFDEWELCLDDFVDGKSIHFKQKEFNATFICEECRAAAGANLSLSLSHGCARAHTHTMALYLL